MSREPHWIVQEIIGGLMAVGLVSIGFVGTCVVLSCSQQSAKSAEQAAACAATRSFYDESDAKLIASGACDKVDVITDCVPHVVLREALIASLEKLECPSPTSQ